MGVAYKAQPPSPLWGHPASDGRTSAETAPQPTICPHLPLPPLPFPSQVRTPPLPSSPSKLLGADLHL